jgi:hypothetical protein
MKGLGFFTAFLMSQAVLAYPAVGDYVRLTGTVTMPTSTPNPIPVSLEIELLSYDAATKQFTVRSITDLAGQIQEEGGLAAETDFMARADIQQILANCPQMGGTKARTSVPAGNFEVCTVSEAKSTSVYSIGDVPFGIVKTESISGDGARTVLSLEKVRFGK